MSDELDQATLDWASEQVRLSDITWDRVAVYALAALIRQGPQPKPNNTKPDADVDGQRFDAEGLAAAKARLLCSASMYFDAEATESPREDAANVLAALEAAEKRIAELAGAMRAQDERERTAGQRCGVPYEENGCDWPDAVADRCEALARELVDAGELHLADESTILHLRQHLTLALNAPSGALICACSSAARSLMPGSKVCWYCQARAIASHAERGATWPRTQREWKP